MRVILQDMLDRTPGALAVSVVGRDGIAVEKVAAGRDVNIDLVSAEGITLVRRITGPAGHHETPEELSVITPSGLLILRALGQDYWLCLVVGRECLPGRARYEAWRAGLALRQAIA
jgi:predicted regulator of Ras-like GTPase activity (Roadblock/LC7/MglB family)